MDSDKYVHKIPPRQSELSKIARDYNSLLWQLKGNISSIDGLAYRLPKQGPLALIQGVDTPATIKAKVQGALATAVDQLEYCEYLLNQLSQSHRDAHRNTQKLIDAAEKENTAHTDTISSEGG